MTLAMPMVAVLFAPPPPAGVSSEPLSVGGLGLLERQIRQVRRAGATRIVVLGPRDWSQSDDDVVIAVSSTALARLIGEDETVLLVAPGLVVDERIFAVVVAAIPATAASAPVIATWPAIGPGLRGGTERIDAGSFSAGVGRYPGAMVREIAARLGDWDMQSTLLRTALADPLVYRLDLASVPLHAPDRSRAVPLVWEQPGDADAALIATGALLAAAQKSCLDWPARFIHPPIENAAVKLLLAGPVSPTMVGVASLVIGAAAAIAFADGWLWTGLALALVCGPLRGIDDRLARVRLEASRLADPDHVADKLVEYGWYIGLAAHFAKVGGNVGPYAVAALLIGFSLADYLQAGFFRRFTGTTLDNAGAFERNLRLLGARRNTLTWALLPFAAAGAWYAGFGVLAAYAVATFFVSQQRLFKRLGDYARARSSTIDRNFAATAPLPDDVGV